MATEVVSIIDPDLGSGYDYDSLYDWEAAQQGDLTGARDEIAVATCRCTGGTADTTAGSVIVDGWTTSATQYIKIWTDPSESYRHNGTYPTGNKYRIEGSAAYATTLDISEAYVRLYGLAIKATNATFPGSTLAISNGTPATSVIYCDSLIVTGGGYDAYTHVFKVSDCTAYISNSVFYDPYNASSVSFMVAYENNGCTAYVYNCIAAKGYYGFRQGSGTQVTFKNCYAGGNSSDDFVGGTKTTCASEDATGTSGLTGIAFSTSNFINVTDGSEDFHLTSSSALIGVGTNLYNDANLAFQADIDGQDRGGSGASWDIGADEYVAAGTTVTVGKQDLTLSVKDPTISIPQSASHSAAKQDLALSILAASVSTSARINIDAGKQDLSFSINSCSYSSDCETGVNKQDLSLSILEPGTKLDSFISASKQDLALSIIQPSISSTQAAQVSVSKQDLTISALQAAVSTSAGIQVIAGVQDLALSVQAPAIRLDSVQDDTTRNITLSINSATVSTASEVNIAAGKQDLALSVNPATVAAQAQNSYSASCQNILLSVLSSFQKIDHYETINKQDLTVAINSPSVSIDALYTAAAAQALSFSQLTIEFFIEHNISAGKQDLYFSVNQVAVSVVQVQGALIAVLNQENMQPAISVSAYQPRVAVN